jgi:tetratricopeptide (TPR) repeat protein
MRTGTINGVWAAAAAALGLTAAGVVAAASGGYFETSWGWIALALLWAAGIALVVSGAVRISLAEVGFAAALTGLLAWTLASTAWAPSADEPVREAERILIYVAAAVAAPLVLRRGREWTLLAALLVGITAVATYALATRLFPTDAPDPKDVSAYRLAEPLGYWNALGIFCAIGIVLGLGFVAAARSRVGAALASASLVILSTTAYFTFSRGAWISLAVGLVAMLALDGRRLRLAAAAVVVAPAAVLAVLLASSAPALKRVGFTLDEISGDGRRLALQLLVLVLLGASLGVAAHALGSEIGFSRRVRRIAGVTAVGAGVLAVATAWVGYESPVALAQRTYDEFRAPPPKLDDDVSDRLFTLSSPGRYNQWKVAWEMAEEHPALGAGAGTFERYWHRNRPVAGKVRDTHNLYLETLAELGPVGLGLLLLALGSPLVAAIRARHAPLVPLAFGAYVAYLAHAAVDWDWEMPAVTLTALLSGSAILAAARSDGLALSPRLRACVVLALVPLAAFALVGQVGNTALAASERATDPETAQTQARKAIRWAPWSAKAIEQLGEAQFEAGNAKAARATFRRALAKNPEDWDLWFDLAVASEGQELRRAVARAHALNPLDPELNALRDALRKQDGGADAAP